MILFKSAEKVTPYLQTILAHKLKADESRKTKAKATTVSSTQNYTMQLLQTTVVLLGLVFVLASAAKLPEIPRLDKEEEVVRRRYLKSEKGGKNNGGGGSGGGETIDRSSSYDSCTPFTKVPSSVIAFTERRDENDACLTENACNTGCCRMYNWLQCDEVSEFYWLEVRRVGHTSIVY
jgi:hypothetical protein